MQTQSKELNFEGQSIFDGIDVHLKNWSVFFTEQLNHQTFNLCFEILVDYKFVRSRKNWVSKYSTAKELFAR